MSDYLHQVIRGRVAVDSVTPRGASASAGRGGVGGTPSSSGGEHPLLRNMHARGGSYAIMMCFHDRGAHAVLTKVEICRHAQPYCNDPMTLNFFAAGGRAAMKQQGWTSIQTLENHRLVQREKGDLDFTNHRVHKVGVDRFALTAEGRAFLPTMVAKLGGGGGGRRGGGGGGGGGGSSGGRGSGRGDGFGEDEDDDRGWDRGWDRGMDSDEDPLYGSGPNGLGDGGSRLGGGGSVKPHIKNADDREELYTWAASAPVGATHEMRICKDRRKYLHRLIESGEVEQSCGVELRSDSYGAGHSRTLLLRVERRIHAPRAAGRPDRPDHTPVAGAKRSADASSEVPSSKRPSSGAGSRVGGSSRAAQSSDPRAMAVLAAERRVREAAAAAASAQPPHSAQPAPPSAQPPRSATGAPMRSTVPQAPVEVLHLSDDDDDDDMLRAAIAASLETSTPASEAAAARTPAARPPAGGPSHVATAARSSHASELTLIVDERERAVNANPLGIFLKVHEELEQTSTRQLPWLAERQQLSLGDFAWMRDGRMLDLTIERKTVKDLVGRSASADHIEQIRRMQRSPLQRSLLLLEGDLYRASAHTAYNAPDRDRRGVREREVVQTAEDVLALVSRLLIDLQHKAKLLQCASTVDTVRQLARLTCLLATEERALAPSEPMPRLDDFQRASSKSAAEAARGSQIEAPLMRAGLDAAVSHLISSRFGDVQSVRQAFGECAPSCRSRLLCPVLHPAFGEEHERRCSQGRRAACCEASAQCHTLLAAQSSYQTSASAALLPSSTAAPHAGGSASTVIDLISDDEGDDEGEDEGDDEGDGQQLAASRSSSRVLHVRLSADLAAGLGGAAPSEVRVVQPSTAATARWLQIHAAQGARRSAAFTVHLVDSKAVEESIGRLRRKMAIHEQAALETGERASAALASAARDLANALLAKVTPIPGPPPARSLLVLVGIEAIARRNGRGGDELVSYAMPLVHTAVASLVLENPSLHVHLASTEAKAMELVRIVMAVCKDEALLTQSS